MLEEKIKILIDNQHKNISYYNDKLQTSKTEIEEYMYISAIEQLEGFICDLEELLNDNV